MQTSVFQPANKSALLVFFSRHSIDNLIPSVAALLLASVSTFSSDRVKCSKEEDYVAAQEMLVFLFSYGAIRIINYHHVNMCSFHFWLCV